ncbi:MAG: hypothetical protein PVJ64_00285 [Gemmatimonadales bacterium]|jgi:prophage tail gpP-like protein
MAALERHLVELRVGGESYRGWTSVTVSYGIETAARSFAFTATSPPSQTTSPVGFQLEDPCEVSIDGDRVITGYVDSVEPSYDASSSGVAVTGRSRTKDLVDCSIVGKRRFRNLALSQIAIRLCAPYSIEVVPPLLDEEPISRFAADEGESVYDAIERAARLRGVLVYDDPEGRLVLWQAGAGMFPLREGIALERGRNVLSGRWSFDATDIYTEYRCRGQSVGTDEEWGDLVAGIEATATDAASARRRVLVLSADSSLSRKRALAQAQWSAANRLGRSTMGQYVIRGWRDDEGLVWEPGELIRVRDAFCRVDADMLITSVDLALSSEGGYTTTLYLAPEAGYLPQLPDNPRAGLGAWRSPV